MGLTPATAPPETAAELERLWYFWLAKVPEAREAFFEEVLIADLRGPGHLPVDEK